MTTSTSNPSEMAELPDVAPLTPDQITLSARTGDLLWTLGNSAEEEEEED